MAGKSELLNKCLNPHTQDSDSLETGILEGMNN